MAAQSTTEKSSVGDERRSRSGEGSFGERRRSRDRDVGLTRDDLEDLRILVVDDDTTLLETCHRILEMEGYRVELCRKGEEAREALNRGTFDLSLLDLYMKGVSGIELLEVALNADPDHVPIVMTGEPTIESSLNTRDLGAFAYLPKPFTATQLKIAVGQAAHHALVIRELREAHESLHGPRLTDDPKILGESEALRETVELAAKLARTDASVFISGESGTGKELIAHFIHERSRRSDKPMLAVNCAALPETLLESEMFGHKKGSFTGATEERQGLLEAADGATLFLDEITEMSLPIQAKLLRVIQDGQVRRVGSNRVDATVDVRFIAATNRDPSRAVSDGTLRKDLYYRLRVVPIRVPSLRERVEDIPILAEHFLQKYWKKHRSDEGSPPKISLEGIRDLQQRDWLGNVRELQNVIEHAVVLAEPGEELMPEDLEFVGDRMEGDSATLDAALQKYRRYTYHDARQELTDAFERNYLKWVVREADGNMSEAARIAEVDRTTLYRLMEKHELSIQREVKDVDEDQR